MRISPPAQSPFRFDQTVVPCLTAVGLLPMRRSESKRAPKWTRWVTVFSLIKSCELAGKFGGLVIGSERARQCASPSWSATPTSSRRSRISPSTYIRLEPDTICLTCNDVLLRALGLAIDLLEGRHAPNDLVDSIDVKRFH